MALLMQGLSLKVAAHLDARLTDVAPSEELHRACHLDKASRRFTRPIGNMPSACCMHRSAALCGSR